MIRTRFYDTHGEYRVYTLDTNDFRDTKVLKYSRPLERYNLQFQEEVDGEIQRLMDEEGLSREEAVTKLEMRGGE